MHTHSDFTSNSKILIVTSVSAERDAVLRGLQKSDRFDIIIGGVGSAAAAANTAAALVAGQYGLIVCAGIAGGFSDQAGIGSLVVASEIVAADLGAETPDGFLSLDELGFGTARIGVDAISGRRIVHALLEAGLTAVSGPILTVTTVTGSAATAEMLSARIPGACAEAMEGYGVAVAAEQRGIPVIEIRAISNAVGPRNREAWRIGDALQALESASTVLMEVLS
ncbi:futalosine hydrolase [Paenibacillus spongiae]|uniref:Futalosine hydrolase n=1 Tax=Paenibacillus spongiae TaxID=2909671 RepID=A0ABY5S1T9_9BACL|nr:futalosine hydrolase [Paenibacillus spongiae]UVI27599.1 futalosine hydrolase [Paenibacillus spongiae]